MIQESLLAFDEFRVVVVQIQKYLLILIPFLIVSALPNIYFGFDSSTSGDIAAMNAQAKAVTQYYREFLDFDESEVEKMVA
ncbi:hypothetical protein, partial [Parabacteroides goldsteinii]|uniref:hypothetical protein n=1 Tax=Parabacteroides goldsteinii TaxID=328812 RepID=UPI002570C0EF